MDESLARVCVDLSGRSKRWIWVVAVIVVILSMSLVAIF
jgi:imidazoleglycerol phosphate dehydratase HisB